MEISSSLRPSEPDESNPTQSPIPNPQSLFSPRAEKLALLLILGVALSLRLHCLTCSSYWHDEGNTWALVQRSFAQIAAAAAADIHPPGYYWLLKLWSLAFGYSPFALRAFSALTGTLTVAVVYAIARSAVGGRRSAVSLFAALLAALNPFQIFYSQEARMYSLLMLESAALVWVALPMADSRRQVIRHHSQFTIRNSLFTISFSLLAAAGLWTHYIFPVVLAAIGLAFLWLRHRDLSAIRKTQYEPSQSPNHPITQSLIPFLLANLIALLLFLPWLPTAIDRVLHWPAGGVDASALDGLRLTLQTLAVGPIRSGPELAWSWLLLVGLLPLIG
ncbi:MAG: glycosyltransferase family 39 protein, partial [Caldilineaceae bacterium]